MGEERQIELVQIQGLGEKRLDLQQVRAKLEAAKGPQYWRCLEELAGSKGFDELLQREFPRQASEWVGGD